MKKIFLTAISFACPLFLGACSLAGGGSAQQAMAMDRAKAYDGFYEAYREAEERYLNLLFNIERMPEEEELWSMKRDQMTELMQLKEMMLNSRTELDNAIQEWEKYLLEQQAQAKLGNTKDLNPNFTGMDGLRTSPGQLLPNEFVSPKKK